MALFTRSRLFGLLFLLALPLEGAAALALSAAGASSADTPPATSSSPAAAPGQELSLEERLQRIAGAVREQTPEDAGADSLPDDALSYVFVNAPAVGWGNGGFRNGGFFNGGFRNGGFYNGGFRNGGFANGGFRNGGGWRNGGFRNGGFRNAW
ncbi:MAG: GrrA/OscA1 family cyclophane-containing rSAM-modified RiPP [Cyanobacteriota bacterium]|nr:GrrA/OscA1 family cyclophane-containing rSAM-modified RiPP [Cyanobacteriota bacterium]